MPERDKYLIYNNYRAIEHDLVNLLRYIDLNENNYKTTSAEIRKIILAACSMIELAVPYIEERVKKTFEKIDRRESVAEMIYRSLKDKEIDLSNLTPMVQGLNFNPWGSSEGGFEWWKFYNASKHVKVEVGTGTFEAAIESVSALFVIVVYITSQTALKLGLFWHSNDLVKICKKGSTRPIQYNEEEALENLLGWLKRS